jgi:hypothetical protein
MYGRILGALLLVAPFAGGHVDTAAAADYWVHSCRTPQGTDAGFDGWTFFASNEPPTSIGEWCPERHAWFRLNAFVDHAPGTLVRGTFRAPADTTIGGYRLYRSFSSNGRPAAYYSQRELPAGSLQDRCWGEEGCFNLGSHANPFGPAPFERARVTGVSALELVVGCFADANPAMTCPPAADHSIELRVHRLDVRLEDRQAPLITTPPSGPFHAADRPLSGVQQITLGAQDRGGGVQAFHVEVDGAVRSTVTPDLNGGACAAPYTRAVPCPLTAAGTVPLDSAALPDGSHQLRVLVADAAGNVTPWGPVAIVTNNVHCSPKPAAPDETLRASFARRRAVRRMTVGFKRRARVTGRLVRADGTPIPNAQLCLLVRRDGRSVPHDAPGPVTDAQGRFRLRLPRGPSRTFWVVHRSGAGAAAKKLRLAVRPRIRVRTSAPTVRNGQRVGFRGRVSGPVPKRGVLVELQVDRGSHWQTFTTARARGRGRFRAAYRFSRTQTAANFRMRVRVPGQASYPYAKGISRPFVVRVTR